MSKKESKDAGSKDAAKESGREKESVKENAPLIRREIFNMETLNILLSSIILVVLLIGPGTGASGVAAGASGDYDEAACRTFCEYNPQYAGALYSGISDEGHCLCEITLDSIPIYAQDKTMTATIILDQGIIMKSVTLTDGIPQMDDLASYIDEESDISEEDISLPLEE